MRSRNILQLISPKRFMVQLVMIFLIFTLGAILAIGIPATLLLQRQSNNQIRTLLEQASQTTQMLLENKHIQMDNLAELIVQRPTLNTLFSTGAAAESLVSYLDEIRQNADVDVILICDGSSPIVLSGLNKGQYLCEAESDNILTSSSGQVWMLAGAAFQGEITVLVGQLFDSTLESFSAQTELAYALSVNGDWAAGSTGLDNNNLPREIESFQAVSFVVKGETVENAVIKIPVPGQPDLLLYGFLNTAGFHQANRQLRTTILIVLVGVSLLAAGIAVIVSRRISRPLNELAVSAARLREGNLNAQLTTVSRLWEIDQLANALEDARVSLKHSLNQLQREKAWTEELLDSIVEGLFTLDADHRVTYASASTSRITGQEPNKILGKSIDVIFKPVEDEDTFSQQIPHSDLIRRIPAIVNGNELLLAVSRSEFIPPEAGNATTALVVRDVSDEERIHNLIGEFLANITHEFRTPLTALSASVELLVDQLPDLSNQEVEQLLLALSIGIVNLQALIDNLIEAASIEAGRFKVNPQTVMLSAILDDAVTTMTPIARLHKVAIVRSAPAQDYVILADRRRTAQVLINLLSNAIKNSPEESKINIRTMLVENEAFVEVQDQGTGIPEDLQGRVFNRFLSSTSPDQKHQTGLGLGLSVVKAVIEAEHGKVGFRSGDKGGAVFWFTLPIVTGRKK